MDKANQPLITNEIEEPPGLLQPLPPTHSNPAVVEPFLPFYPRYFETALTQSQQKLYSRNGYVSLVKSLQVQVVSQIDQCRQLWQEFTPNQSLFDTWEFRLAFWQAYRHQPYFLVLKTEAENVGLLPLWHESEKDRYVWFGSTWHEDNSFFVKDRLFIPLLLAAAPPTTFLNAITPNSIGWLDRVISFEPDDSKFILNLKPTNSLETYLAGLKKKQRYNLKRDQRIIENQQPQVVLNRFTDLKILVQLCNQRFAQKGELTDWEKDPRSTEAFRRIISLGRQTKTYGVKMITVTIGSKIAAVDLVVVFNQSYYPLVCGYNVADFPGIGNYLSLREIEDAVALNMAKIDFLEGECNWKHRWFKPTLQLKYRKLHPTT